MSAHRGENAVYAIMKFFALIISLSLLLTGTWLVATSASSQAVVMVGRDSFGGGGVATITKPGQQQGNRVTVQHGLIAAEEDLPGFFSWSEAQISCDSLSLHGYDDWYLPDKDELNRLFFSKGAVGGFLDTLYWNSTPNDAQEAWSQDFFGGTQNSVKKSATLRVRPVRKF